jgi:hypothetical protein
MASTTPCSTSSENRPQYQRGLYSEDDPTIEFLLGSFVLIDVISCASLRSGPFLQLDHKLEIDTPGISVESLMGCRDSVLTLIFEITLLDRWKREAEEAHKLSIMDLANRGSQISERPREELSDVENMGPAETTQWTPQQSSRRLLVPQISKVFALSALTYLHVVISGAYPELPEIIESVSETVIVLKNLNDPTLLRYVVWPFCVAGCLAREECINTKYWYSAGDKKTEKGVGARPAVLLNRAIVQLSYKEDEESESPIEQKGNR